MKCEQRYYILLNDRMKLFYILHIHNYSMFFSFLVRKNVRKHIRNITNGRENHPVDQWFNRSSSAADKKVMQLR